LAARSRHQPTEVRTTWPSERPEGRGRGGRYILRVQSYESVCFLFFLPYQPRHRTPDADRPLKLDELSVGRQVGPRIPSAAGRRCRVWESKMRTFSFRESRSRKEEKKASRRFSVWFFVTALGAAPGGPRCKSWRRSRGRDPWRSGAVRSAR